MSTQSAFDPGKTKSPPSWLQKMAATLGFSSALSLRETLESAISETPQEEDTSLSPQERTMLLNVLGFGETRVAEVMIPRADIVALEDTQPLSALLACFSKAGHSRVPVFRDSLDNPVGMAHIKDVMALVTGVQTSAAPQTVGGSFPNIIFGSEELSATIAEAKIVREVLFVPPSMPALALLAKMKATKIHLALVVDEFGGTDGLVTFGDLVEAIVGDIDDEHDRVAPAIDFEGEAFVASARTPIEDIEQALGMSLETPGVPSDIDTIGGLIMATLGSVPKRGQVVAHPSGVTFEIVEAGPRRIHAVRILKPRALPAPEAPLLLPPPEPVQGERSRGANGVRGAKAA